MSLGGSAGRLLQDGIPYADLLAAEQRDASVEWLDFWVAKGDSYERLAEDALAAGHSRSAAELLFLASMSYHYGQYVWWHEPARRQRAQRRKAELYRRAAPLLARPARRVEIPFRGAVIPGYLRLPEAAAAPGLPCAVLLGGLESTKEEWRLFEDLLLDRGVATFAFDGPGQGELWEDVKLAPDFEAWASAVVDHLCELPEIDSGRLGVIGRSLGGHYALKSAAADARFRACASWGGFFDMRDFERRPAKTKAGYSYVAGLPSAAETREYVQRALDCASVIEQLSCPVYMLHGAHDPITMEQVDLVAAGAPRAQKELVVEPDGDHCCHNLGPRTRLAVADWITDRLTAENWS
jgi:2,6-dihydroxypseudooxynicotine hydrolase